MFELHQVRAALISLSLHSGRISCSMVLVLMHACLGCTECALHLSAFHCILHKLIIAVIVTVLVLVHACLGCTGCALDSGSAAWKGSR